MSLEDEIATGIAPHGIPEWDSPGPIIGSHPCHSVWTEVSDPRFSSPSYRKEVPAINGESKTDAETSAEDDAEASGMVIEFIDQTYVERSIVWFQGSNNASHYADGIRDAIIGRKRPLTAPRHSRTSLARAGSARW